MSGIKADHKPIEEWIRLVEDGAILLPDFQRDEVWTHHKVETLFDSILKGRPVGCLLVLEVDDPGNLLFSPHKIGGGKPNPEEPCEYQLLDGQQRIVALWRALTDRHKERIFFVKTETENGEDSWIKSHKRPAESRRATSWMGKPKECMRRGLIPLRLFRARATTETEENWIDEAVKHFAMGDASGDSPEDLHKMARDLERKIRQQSEVIRNFQIPFLALPPDTSQEVAIDVFIRTNTSSTQLTKFDITVGEVRSKSGQDLRTALGLIEEQVPGLEHYLPKRSEVGDLAMKIACLWNRWV